MTQALQADSRFKAGVDLDGQVHTASRGFDQPLMFLYNSNLMVGVKALENALRGGGYAIKILRVQHEDFGELSMMWRLASLPGRCPEWTSTDDPVRVNRIIADYTVAFFDRMLKGHSAPLLNGPPPDYPEVEFTIFGNPQGVSGIPGEEWALY